MISKSRWIVVALIILISIVACREPEPGQEQECPPVTPIPTIHPSQIHQSKAIYILLDNSGSYEEEFYDARELLNEFLAEALKPGDMIGVGLIGVGIADVPVSTTILPENIPEQVATYEKLPIPTPLSDADNRIGSLAQQHQNAKDEVEEQNSRIETTYYCEVSEWNNAYSRAIGNQNPDIQVFLSDVRTELAKITTREGNTDIYSAMFKASDFFKEARQQGYDHLALYIFSDMSHYAVTEPNEAWAKDINLTNVDVVVAMIPYESAQVYSANIDVWEDWFFPFGGASPEFLAVPHSNKQRLLALLGG